MMFSPQIIGALAQVLGGLSTSGARTLLLKHFDDVPEHIVGSERYFAFLRYHSDSRVIELIEDLLMHSAYIRLEATPRYGFDIPFADLNRWLAHDGWELRQERLLSGLPAIEESTEVRDRLIQALTASPVDAAGTIRKSLELASDAFKKEPPDLNAATTNVRIALETTARRSVVLIAAKFGDTAPSDTWGNALLYLRERGVITRDEEHALAASYTLISDGAHVPTGMANTEWARVSRTIALSLAYFLITQADSAL